MQNFPSEAIIHQWLESKSSKTRVTYLSDLREFTSFITGGRGKQIQFTTAEDCRAYRQYLLKKSLTSGNSMNTAVRRFRLIKAFFDFCVEYRYMIDNPAEGIILRREDGDSQRKKLSTSIRVESKEDAALSGFSSTGEMQERLAYLLLRYPDIRPLDLRDARRCDVFILDGSPFLYLRQQERSIPLSGEVWQLTSMLTAISGTLQNLNDPLFKGLSAEAIRNMEERVRSLVA